MTHPIQIRTPCPKLWDDLQGDERKRFCSECSLHVHNSAALTRREAEALVAGAEGRVCMRIECDPSGALVFRDTSMARLGRWALTAGATLLAACQRGSIGSVADPKPVEPPSRMGRVAAHETLGGVAAPPQPREMLGEAAPAAPAPPKPK
jgi:hypothetical protein